jgi:hypothetical protein
VLGVLLEDRLMSLGYRAVGFLHTPTVADDTAPAPI